MRLFIFPRLRVNRCRLICRQGRVALGENDHGHAERVVNEVNQVRNDLYRPFRSLLGRIRHLASRQHPEEVSRNYLQLSRRKELPFQRVGDILEHFSNIIVTHRIKPRYVRVVAFCFCHNTSLMAKLKKKRFKDWLPSRRNSEEREEPENRANRHWNHED